MNATSQDVSCPSTPFPIQSKELNQGIELNWEDWCWFMLLLCSDSSSFFLLSHLWRGKTPLLSWKAFPGQTVLSEGSWGRQSLFFQVSGRDIIPARGLLRQYVSMVLTNSAVPGLSSVPNGTDHFWVLIGKRTTYLDQRSLMVITWGLQWVWEPCYLLQWQTAIILTRPANKR